MSIRIDHGLAATDPDTGHILNSGSVFWATEKIRQITQALFFDRLWELFCDMSPEQLGLDIQYHDSPGMSLRGVAERVGVLHAQGIHTFDPLDLGYDISLLDGTDPTDEPGRGSLLLMIHGEQAESPYIPALEKAGLVRRYGYWDNTDGPEDLSDLQWQNRKRVWGQALSSVSTPEPFALTPEQAGATISHPAIFTTLLELQKRYRNNQDQQQK